MATSEIETRGFEPETAAIHMAEPKKEPAKNKGGRPRSPRAKPEGESGDAEQDDDFFLNLKRVDPEEWTERLFMYLYRTAPLIDRKQTAGQHNNIEKISEPVDQNDIMLRHGSGGYKLILIRYDPSAPRPQQYKKVREKFFRIFNPKFPPKIPLGDWIDDPRNKDWEWAKRIMEAEQMTGQPQGNNGAGGDATAMFQAAVSAVKELRPDATPDESISIARFAIEQMRENQKGGGDTNALVGTLVTALITAITNRPAAAPAGPDPATTMLLDELKHARNEAAEERKFARELMLKQQNGGGLKDKLEELQLLKGLTGFFRNAPAAPAAESNWIQELGSKAIDALPLVVSAMTRTPPTRPAIPATATPATANPNTATPAGDAQSQPEENPETMIGLINNQYGHMFDTIVPQLVDQFQRGLTGMDFRDWLCDEYGAATWRTLKAMHTETLLGVLDLRKKEAPDNIIRELLAKLTPRDKVAAFIEEFKSDEESPNAGEDDDDDTTPPATPAVTPNVRTF